MGGLPVPVNNNLEKAVNQLPIAGSAGVDGRLGGIKADGTTIVVDQTTGVASSTPSGASISGLTEGYIPLAGGPASITGDSALDDGVSEAGVISSSEPVIINDTAGANGTALDIEPDLDAGGILYDCVYIEMSNVTNISGGLRGIEIANGQANNTSSLFINGPPAAGNNYAIRSTALADSVFDGAIWSAGYLKTTAKHSGTVIPAATAGVGARDFVTDSMSTTFGDVYSSGGTNKVPIYCDGTNWYVG